MVLFPVKIGGDAADAIRTIWPGFTQPFWTRTRNACGEEEGFKSRGGSGVRVTWRLKRAKSAVSYP